MNPLLLVIPFCQKDHVNAAQLLRWMAELQPHGHRPHSCLLAADNIVPEEVKKAIFQLAKPQFAYTDLLRIPVPQDRQNWIGGSNFMFEQVSRTISECIKHPWFWCEPDCVPLQRGWLDQLASAYADCPVRFLGAHIKAINQPNMPALHMAGCAIYDAQAHEGMKEFAKQTTQAFDIAAAQYTVMRSRNTPLIQHFWGKPDMAPTFRETKAGSDPENTIPMGYLRPDAVLWHRCKDGTLINCLRKRMAPKFDPVPEPEPTPFVSEPIPAKRGPGRPRKNPEPVTAT